METLFTLSVVSLMAICNVVEPPKSPNELGIMPNSYSANSPSGASFNVTLNNKESNKSSGESENSNYYPYYFPCYFGTKERLGQTGKIYIKENKQDCMLVEPGDVFLCKFKLEHPLDLRGGMEFLYSQEENGFFVRTGGGAFLESDHLTKAAFGRHPSPEGGIALKRGMTTAEMYSYLNSAPLIITGYEPQKFIGGYKWIDQFATSFYHQRTILDSTGQVIGWSSEPNCVLNSTFSVLYNLPRVSSPTGTLWQYDSNLYQAGYLTSVNLTNPKDSLYDSLGVGRAISTGVTEDNQPYTVRYYPNNGQSASFPTGDVLNRIPAGYSVLRQEAINLGYTGEGSFSYWNFPNLLESLNSTYSVSIDGLRWQNQETVAANIDYGIPSVIGVMGSPRFRDHAMSVYGYVRYYERVYTSHGAYSTISKFFWAVDSGYQADTDSNSIFLDSDGKYRCWYTPDGYYETYTTINRSSLTWPTC